MRINYNYNCEWWIQIAIGTNLIIILLFHDKNNFFNPLKLLLIILGRWLV